MAPSPSHPFLLPSVSFIFLPVSSTNPPADDPHPRQSVDKRTIIENYDLVSLAIDEIVDDGIILETDPLIITQRVSRAPTQDVVQLKGIDLSEQGMNTLAQYGKNKLGDWLRQGL